jgi:hypothetical protein
MRASSRRNRAVSLIVAGCAIAAAPPAAVAVAGEKPGPVHHPAKVVLHAPPKAPRRLAFGQLTNIGHSGSAIVLVAVPGSGKLVVSGHNISTARLTTRFGGAYPVGIAATGSLKCKLSKPGSATIDVHATFAPRGGKRQMASKTVKLVKRLGGVANLVCEAFVHSNNPYAPTSWSNWDTDSWVTQPSWTPYGIFWSDEAGFLRGCSTTVQVKVMGSHGFENVTINLEDDFPGYPTGSFQHVSCQPAGQCDIDDAKIPPDLIVTIEVSP